MSLLSAIQNETTESKNLDKKQIAKEVAEKTGSEAEPERTGSDVALGAAIASVGLSLYEYYVEGDKQQGLFVGLWAPTILAFASYLKQKSMEERLEQSIVAGSTVRGVRNLLK